MSQAIMFILFIIFACATPLLMAIFAKRSLCDALRYRTRFSIWASYIVWSALWIWVWNKMFERTWGMGLKEKLIMSQFWIMPTLGMTLMFFAERRRRRVNASRGFDVKVIDQQ